MNQNKIGQIILILSVINFFHGATAPSGLLKLHDHTHTQGCI